MHISFLGSKITIYLVKKAQMALLLAEERIILAKNSDFADIFLKKLANVLLKQTKENEHLIKLE